MLPALPGVGFKPEHFAAIRQNSDGIGFFEVHAENYMGAGGCCQTNANQSLLPQARHSVRRREGRATL